MYEIEPSGFCTIHEYRRYFEKRKQANEISIGELLLVLADIRTGKTDKEALKFPIKAKTIELVTAVVANVTADILDLDLKPKETAKFTLTNGVSRSPRICEVSTSQPVKEMYIRDYEDYVGLEPIGDLVLDEIGQQELIAA